MLQINSQYIKSLMRTGYSISVKYKQDNQKKYFHTYYFHMVFDKESKDNNCFVALYKADEYEGTVNKSEHSYAKMKDICLFQGDLSGSVPRKNFRQIDRKYVKYVMKNGNFESDPDHCCYGALVRTAMCVAGRIIRNNKEFMSDKDSNKLYEGFTKNNININGRRCKHMRVDTKYMIDRIIP